MITHHLCHSQVEITPLQVLGPDLEPLVVEAEQEGFGFMRRLVCDWASGANRFDRAGELCLGARSGGQLIAVGGLNRDPYVVGSDDASRLRHVYVLASARRQGVGALLVRHILEHACQRFRVVRLRTAKAETASFYLRLGFTSTSDHAATHIMVLDRFTRPDPI